MKQDDYEDIINLPHHQSSVHPRMSMAERAAQFSPFAALTGYEGVIREAARQTEERIELDESEREDLDRKLKEWSVEGGDRRRIQATWFVPDETKAGGTYVTAEGVVKKVDGYEKVLILEDGSRIRTEDIIRLEELSPEKGETGEEKMEKQAKGGNEGI